MDYPLVIEAIEEAGTDWGVSVGGPNPEPEDYIGVRTRHDAEKLRCLLTRLMSVIVTGAVGKRA